MNSLRTPVALLSLLVVSCYYVLSSPLCDIREHSGFEGPTGSCCAVSCSNGQESIGCVSGHKFAQCQTCPPHTYQDSPHPSDQMVRCSRHLECEGSTRYLSEGNSTHNAVCSCNLDDGYYSPSGTEKNPSDCIQKQCGSGMELDSSGNCIPCQSGQTKVRGYGRCVDSNTTSLPVSSVFLSQWNATLTSKLVSTDITSTSSPDQISLCPPPLSVVIHNILGGRTEVIIVCVVCGLFLVLLAAVVWWLYKHRNVRDYILPQYDVPNGSEYDSQVEDLPADQIDYSARS